MSDLGISPVQQQQRKEEWSEGGRLFIFCHQSTRGSGSKLRVNIIITIVFTSLCPLCWSTDILLNNIITYLFTYLQTDVLHLLSQQELIIIYRLDVLSIEW